MKTTLLLIFLTIASFGMAQQTHTVEVPKGVTYNYCDDATLEKAQELITKELTETPTYAMCGMITFVGPVLWTRFKKVKSLSKIEGGNVTNLVDNQQLPGKMTQRVDDSKLVWDALRADIGNNKFELRLANQQELNYYWSVISFDIEEPLIIVETKAHNYILNLAPTNLKLTWLDEAPRK
jgi:hypothetical protein